MLTTVLKLNCTGKLISLFIDSGETKVGLTHIGLYNLHTEQFSNPGGAIGPMRDCGCVCLRVQTITSE